MGDMQTNKQLGRSTMALHTGGTPGYVPAVPFLHGTPNQKDEAHSVALRAHLPPDPLAPHILDACLERLIYQERNGHCTAAAANEQFSDSHCPIEYRAQASLLTTAYELATGNAVSKDGLKVSVGTGMSSKYNQLLEHVMLWWSHEIYLCDLHLVRTGPLAGYIVGVGARFAIGWNDVRNVCYQLIRKRADIHKPNKWWDNTLKFQDTFGAHLVQELVYRNVFDQIHPVAPKLRSPLTVYRFENGHVSAVNSGIQAGDPAQCWVHYPTGKVGTGIVGDGLDMGNRVTTVQIG